MVSSSGEAVRRIGTDPQAFEAFYRAHVDAVERFIARRVADPHRAADLTAEVFLATIESAEGYKPSRGAPVAWLYGIARNVLAGDRRRSARERDAGLRLAGRRLVEGDDIARLHERIDAEAQARTLYEAMSRLPAHERAVLELVAVDGLSVSEAGKALGIRAPTARVRLHRARRRVRDHFGAPVSPPAVSAASGPRQ
ncbi:RNA polymerase sigma factor [Streptomyces sp. NBC_01808]|uniref:RNA polymerase sigma factor n=1 Tax=Streptomyces sp. NBC_01808 TaxID=2975947 RepID=UPI002DD98CB3|nr:RNA polymerase sigma factor [Streptomyces sp. NBC_01808]WSA38809.1 RNA polymerase sigma factor [Streptomyces sp. NBC_01808]